VVGEEVGKVVIPTLEVVGLFEGVVEMDVIGTVWG
jgi:hypothetical protein